MDKESNNTNTNLLKEFEQVKYLLTETEFSALKHQLPMTQELYNSILDKIMLIIPSADNLLFHILQNPQYENFMIKYADKIEPN